ncbi:hypothetical protein [Williamsia sp. CHRR-6]|uniref:hypothetical protein n=1 Tax=Williamsia sp. CHRR-6 TaxID=2835871 RepID=UPI001BDB68E6|nr:hypothetical protein [Williamsia sp. CHRR-6]MBT0567709.1 hypothetical protein [Williamsia sp. CHRR-6]
MTIETTTTAHGVDFDRSSGAVEIQVQGSDGSTVTLIQFPDGTIEVRTAGMNQSGHAIAVRPAGHTEPIRR